ncbi:MAG: elongation factor P [Fimbriimonadaceae bacterium]|nr:elongation factor P [Fimbriimonadaceae bacterium]
MDTSDFKNGVSIVQDGDVWQIIEFQHVKPGKGGAFVRTKLKQLRTGKVVDKTFRAGEKMDQAIVERRNLQYLYQGEGVYAFMDMETFEQMEVPATLVGDKGTFLTDSLDVQFTFWNEQVLALELPTAVVAEVVETDPGVRGDTASGGNKPAKIASGATVTVPLFINIGDVIKVDTRTGAYVERVKT